MKLISLNIEGDKHHDLVLPFLKKENSDVICLQEILEIDFSRYKKELRLEGVFCPHEYYADPHPSYKNLVGRKQGIALFAKDILSSGFSYYVGKEANLSKSFQEFLADDSVQENKVLLWANVGDSAGMELRIATTHLIVTKDGDSTPLQLECLDLLLKKLDTLGEFVICGDFNAPRGGETFRRLAAKYKDNISPKYKTSLDQKLHRVPGLMHMVDGLFTTPLYEASDVKLVDGVSDHMAIIGTINRCS